MNQNEKQYRNRFFITIAAYIVLLIISVSVVEQVDNAVLRYAVAIMPVLPILFGLAAFIRYLRGLDELQRAIQFEGFAFSIALTGVITFSLGFLENAGLPSISLIWVFPMLIFFWGIGTAIASRRYR